jgi:CarD family transcriptional regulator
VNDRNPAQGVRPSTDSAKSPTANDAPIENAAQRYGFNVNEFIVYPTHGVGQILAIEEQEIAGAKLELFVINFMKDKMTLRVPTKRVANVRMRKLSDPETIQRVGRTLSQRRRVPVGHWFRLAQEYEAKINSGDIIAIAEVMRDLYRPGQSHSERQLYEAALDRLAEEVSFVQQISKEQAIEELEKLVIAGAGGGA